MTTFALIHGAMHGGWCWELLTPELDALGHRTVAPDLPYEDEAAGAEAWARTVIDAVDAVVGHDDTDVVVVGHSLGGMGVPMVASMRPVRRMVFLGAMVPAPGRVYAEYVAENPDYTKIDVAAVQGSPGPAGIAWETARCHFYDDCDEEISRQAFDRLRPVNMTVFTERYPIDEWPDTPSTYILLKDDRAVSQDWSRRAAKRVGADLIEMEGGHSPFLSRPKELAGVLASL